MKNGVKYICKASPIYLYLKKHFCPNCGSRVIVKCKSQLVDSKSEDAANYDFTISDTTLVGTVEFRTVMFYCEKCDAYISIPEMKRSEKADSNNMKQQ